MRLENPRLVRVASTSQAESYELAVGPAAAPSVCQRR